MIGWLIRKEYQKFHNTGQLNTSEHRSTPYKPSIKEEAQVPVLTVYVEFKYSTEIDECTTDMIF